MLALSNLPNQVAASGCREVFRLGFRAAAIELAIYYGFGGTGFNTQRGPVMCTITKSFSLLVCLLFMVTLVLSGRLSFFERLKRYLN